MSFSDISISEYFTPHRVDACATAYYKMETIQGDVQQNLLCLRGRYQVMVGGGGGGGGDTHVMDMLMSILCPII